MEGWLDSEATLPASTLGSSFLGGREGKGAEDLDVVIYGREGVGVRVVKGCYLGGRGGGVAAEGSEKEAVKGHDGKRKVEGEGAERKTLTKGEKMRVRSATVKVESKKP